MARKKTFVAKIKEIPQDEDVRYSIDQLENEVREAVAEALAYYLRTPDTLRALVRDEIGRSEVRRVSGSYNDKLPKELVEALRCAASKLADEELRNPEVQDALIQEMKNQYIETYKSELSTHIKRTAYMDAHRAYSRAMSPERKRNG